MRQTLRPFGYALGMALASALGAPAAADDIVAFSNRDTFRIGGVDLQLGETADRWSSSRGGSIALDGNTFIFGREDTYETITTRRGLDRAGTGATIGVGMGFSF